VNDKTKPVGRPVTARDRLIVALDVPTAGEAMDLVRLLKDEAGLFKVGMQLFYGAGPDIVRRIVNLGCRVFLDLKMHDIPNTVAAAAASLTGLGAAMFNVHAAGGWDMMGAAVRASEEAAKAANLHKPLILGVTVLTSLGQKDLNQEIGIPGPVEERVAAWARLAQTAGLGGVVASPHEVQAIRATCGPKFVIVTPGVRPAGVEPGDQKRVMTPGEAIREGADYLVIGRPIIKAADPQQAAREIILQMEV